jgi:hypothetical protein
MSADALRELLAVASVASETAIRAATAMLRDEPEAAAVPRPPLIDPDLIPIAGAAKAVGKSKETMRRWAWRNGFAVLVGGRVHVVEARLRDFLAGGTRT